MVWGGLTDTVCNGINMPDNNKPKKGNVRTIGKTIENPAISPKAVVMTVILLAFLGLCVQQYTQVHASNTLAYRTFGILGNTNQYMICSEFDRQRTDDFVRAGSKVRNPTLSELLTLCHQNNKDFCERWVVSLMSYDLGRSNGVKFPRFPMIRGNQLKMVRYGEWPKDALFVVAVSK